MKIKKQIYKECDKCININFQILKKNNGLKK